MNKLVGVLALIAVVSIGVVSLNTINSGRTSSNSQASSQDFFPPLNYTFTDWTLQNMPKKWNKGPGTSLEQSSDVHNSASGPYSLKLNSGSITSSDFSMIPFKNGQEEVLVQVDSKKASGGKLKTTISVKRASDKSTICTVKAEGYKEIWTTWSLQTCKMSKIDQSKPMFFEITTERGSVPILIDNIGIAQNITP